MHHFDYRHGVLHAEAVDLADVATAVGTPFYCYSTATLRRHYEIFAQAFADVKALVCYAMKANSNQAVIKTLAELGAGADVVSGGELRRARAAGITPEKIMFSGIGKTASELASAVDEGILCVNVESEAELELLSSIASAKGRTARISIRVNPDIDAKTHANISTGLRINKFGVALEDARGIYRARRELPGLRFTGVHVHIGSQITSAEPLQRAAEALAGIALQLREDGVPLEHVDLGGGLGIPYEGKPMIAPSEYAAAVLPALRRCGLPVVLEPGRAIVGRSGALVSRIVDTKQNPDGRRFAVLDAGMTELMRPALYGSYHRIEPVQPRAQPAGAWDIVGPICESSDAFGRERELPPLAVGDLVAVLDTGAYGAVMGSNYNRRLLAPEVLVDGGGWTVIRRRQTLDDVLALES